MHIEHRSAARLKLMALLIQIVLGLAGTILTALLVTSIIVTRFVDQLTRLRRIVITRRLTQLFSVLLLHFFFSIGQLDNEFCGGPCGYIFSGKNLPNPLNILFLKLSPVRI